LDRITSNSHRTSEVFDAFRALFGKAGQARQPIDMNEIVLGVLQSFDGELKSHGVTMRTELTSGLRRLRHSAATWICSAEGSCWIVLPCTQACRRAR
jgi:hypothetical protein